MKKKLFIKTYFVVSLCFLSQIIDAQTSETAVKETIVKEKLTYPLWSLGPVIDVKAIQNLIVYDFGVQASRSLYVGHRLRFEASYRTSASNLEINWGSIPMNLKANIGSLILGAGYDWFPFVASGTHSGFLKSLKVIGGVWYVDKPDYFFNAYLQDPLNWGQLTFSAEEIGTVATDIKTNKVQPFLGLGYDEFYRGEHISFSINGGLLYHGKPEVTMVATNMLKPTEENAARLEQNLSGYQFTPLLQLLLQYNF